MADFAKKYGTSEKLETEGVKVPTGDDGSYLVIARFGNPTHAEVTRQLMRSHRAAQRAGTLSDAIFRDVTIKGMARAILLGWGGQTDDGKSIEYTIENAEKMLT